MAKDNSSSFNNNSSLHSEPGSNKSFVKKVRSRVSGLLPSSLSKWFGNDDNNKATVRQREDDDDDEYCEIQPPSKRAKLPSPTSLHNNFHVNSVSPTTFSINETNRIHNATTGDRQNNFKSTLLEPIAGPSGVKSKKLFAPSFPTHYNPTENLLNGDKDSDSGESTSGYSSMPHINHKNIRNIEDAKKDEPSTLNVNPNNLFNSSTFGGHSRSLFAERSLSPQINSSLSSRRPSFNASTFGSPNFVDRTLSTKRIINSPFYNGRTTYGGASAYGLQQNKSPQVTREAIRKQVQIKPVNQSVVSENASLSKTARRILDTLEQYGTPVSDAKKIPNPSLKKPRQDGLLAKYTGANPYLMREHKASNRELQLPTVPDLLKMKLKERLQDSTVAVRQIATTSKSTLNSDEYKIRTAEEEIPKHTNKIKNKVTSVRHKPDNEAVEMVKLPEVALPITTLPKFDFSLPLPPSCSKPLVTVACSEPSKLPEKNISKTVEETHQKDFQPTSNVVQEKSNPETVEYTFANPLVLAENLVSIIAINDFKFSDPVIKQKGAISTKSPTPVMFNFKSSDVSNKFKSSDLAVNFKSSDSANIVLKRKSQNKEELVQPAAQLLPGSVEDILTKKPKTQSSLLDKFKPAAGTWECSSCMLRNLPDKLKCAACEAPKDKIETANKSLTFGDKFKMSADKWECSACMVRNASSDTKCVACTTPKPVSTKPNGPITSIPNMFGDKFKAPSSTWECPTCMIRNNNEAERCVACETNNPTKKTTTSSNIGFGNNFKKKSTEWECEACMVRNPSEKIKCLACETPKPGADLSKLDTSKPETQPIVHSFNFGFFPGATTTTEGFKIDPPQSMKGDDETASKTSISSIFGNKAANAVVTTEASSVPTFTFGIPPKAATTDTPTKVSEQKMEPLFKPSVKLPEKPLSAPTGFVFNSSSVKSDKPASPTGKPLPSSLSIPKPEQKAAQQPVNPPSASFNFGSNLSKPMNKPDSTKIEPAAAPKPTETFIQKPVGGFTFGTSASLKRSTNDTDLQSSGIATKKEAPSPASIVFSPPKQPLVANKSDLNLLSKPALPLNGNSSKIEKNVFGSLTSMAAPAHTVPNSSFTFTSSQSKPTLPATSANTQLFNFGAKTTSVPVFGNPTATTTEAPIFKFGAPLPEQPSTQSGFNINPNMQPAASNVFGGNSSTSIFGAPSKPVFETPGKSVFEASSKPVFETPNKTVFDAPSKPIFETAAPTSAFGSGVHTGFQTSATSSEIKPFSFGAQPSENPSAPKAPAFSFGQSSKPAEPAKAAPAFSFGSSAPANAPAGGFSFNTTNTNPAPSGGFSFNAPKVDNPSPFQSAASAPSIFGKPAQVHSQPQQPAQPVQNGGFNFGAPAANNNVKTGFNFGVATPAPQFNQAPLAPSGVFSFGSNPNSAPAAPGGFNFGPSPAAPPPAFNANLKPTFNFTGGATPTFSAQPTGESAMVAQRKKIRAVRRTQR